MKQSIIYKVQSLVILLLAGLYLNNHSVVLANARGDDYPYTAIDAVDQWGLYTRQCTSFVAYRLSTVNGFTLPRAYGNADVWGSRARQEGYRVDLNPSVGSVAWWDSMHVAWVSAVHGDTIEIEEYNYGRRYTYNKRNIPRYSVSGYIHFKDLQTSSSQQTSAMPTNGTYRFTHRTGIKSEARLSSADLDYYDVGETVRYDQAFEAEGYQWISYIGYSGKRRYVPIKPIGTPKPSPAVLPSQGTYTLTTRSSIRNAPSLSSPEITFYGAGASVRYDRIITSEGRQWISYISYSGVRRYIAI